MSNPVTSLPPGFRFHPTDEELIQHYLKNRAASAPCPVSIIAEVDIYKFNPWDLPEKAMFGDREWYFFTPRDRKYPNGVRPNRAAGSGYWKATGTDKPIQASTGKESIGVKKALVFYKGKPPKGTKTNWIMHEYRIAEVGNTNTYKPMKLRDHSMRLDDWVLCRIYKKNNNIASVPPPLMDQEQEDSVSGGADDTYMPNMQTITEGKIPKSFSVSEFLEDYSNISHMFDTQPELPGFDYNSLMQQPSSSELLIDSGCYNSNGNNYLMPNRFETQQHNVIDENPSVKRQRINDSCFVPNFSNQFDSPQYNSLFNNQQLLMKSHLGLH